MKELNAFELFGKISDDYVTEAVIPSAQILPLPKRSFSETAFSRFINGPWGVAMLCAVVSIGVLVGIIAAGNAGDPGKTPVGNTVVSGISGDPESETPPDGATTPTESTTVTEGTDSMQEATMPEETTIPEETTTSGTSEVTTESTEIETSPETEAPAESAATEETTAFEEITLPEVSTEPKETVRLPEAVALPEHPTIEQSQYGEEAVILYDEEIFAKDLLYVDANSGANPLLTEDLYTRVKQTEDYLGVDIVFQGGANESAIDLEMWKLKSAGEPMSHLVMTKGEALAAQHHVLADLSALEMIRMDADYWDGEMMRSHAIDGGVYFGTNAFIPPNAYLLAYNKDLYRNSGLSDDLYALVENNGWTLDKMMSLATEAEGCKYGFASPGAEPLRAFQTGSEIRIIDAEDTPDGPNQSYVYDDYFERASSLFFLMKDFFADEHVAIDSMKYEPIGDGNVLFEPMMSREFSTRRGGRDLGVLPFPKYDSGQKQYVPLYASGYLGIFADDHHLQMCGDVAELLAYCSKDVRDTCNRAYLGLGAGELSPSQKKDLDMMTIIHDAKTDLGMTAPALYELNLFMPLKWVNGDSGFGINFGSRLEAMATRELNKWGYD